MIQELIDYGTIEFIVQVKSKVEDEGKWNEVYKLCVCETERSSPGFQVRGWESQETGKIQRFISSSMEKPEPR